MFSLPNEIWTTCFREIKWKKNSLLFSKPVRNLLVKREKRHIYLRENNKSKWRRRSEPDPVTRLPDLQIMRLLYEANYM